MANAPAPPKIQRLKDRACKTLVPHPNVYGTGAPTMFTPETRTAILTALVEGQTRRVAAALGGISYNCMYMWLRRGQTAFVEGQWHPDDEPYVNFYKAVAKAEAEAHALQVTRILDAAKHRQGWAAAAWYLERKYPMEWGRKDVVSVNGTVQYQHTHLHRLQLAQLSDADLDRLREIAQRAKPPKIVNGHDAEPDATA